VSLIWMEGKEEQRRRVLMQVTTKHRKDLAFDRTPFQRFEGDDYYKAIILYILRGSHCPHILTHEITLVLDEI